MAMSNMLAGFVAGMAATAIMEVRNTTNLRFNRVPLISGATCWNFVITSFVIVKRKLRTPSGGGGRGYAVRSNSSNMGRATTTKIVATKIAIVNTWPMATSHLMSDCWVTVPSAATVLLSHADNYSANDAAGAIDGQV
eukprot:1191160-Prorocentrum_minimum.AAC.2